MKKVYTIEIILTIDTEHQQEFMAKAKRLYRKRGGAVHISDDGAARPLPPREAIQDIDDALMLIMDAHPAFDDDGIELTSLSCDTDETLWTA